MRPSLVLESKREAVRAAAERYPVTNLRVFGSVATGADDASSDIDFMVDTLPHTSLFDLGGLYEDLHDLLGVPIDLVTSNELPESWKDAALAQAIQI